MDNRKIIAVLFGLILLLVVPLTLDDSVFTDKKEKENAQSPEVLLQLELRDSNGSLVAYIESEEIRQISLLELNIFLDNQNQTRKEFFIKDDKKYEIQQWEIASITHDRKDAISIGRLLDVYQNELVTLLTMRFDSVQVQPGDTMRIFWTIIRPAS